VTNHIKRPSTLENWPGTAPSAQAPAAMVEKLTM
jgi:hypothetical protein